MIIIYLVWQSLQQNYFYNYELFIIYDVIPGFVTVHVLFAILINLSSVT